MAKKRMVLRFPPELVNKPVTYKLVKDYNLVLNILRARIMPNEQGMVVTELSGAKADLEKGIKYLSDSGIEIQPLARDIKWDRKKCIHCTVCVPLCPTETFVVDKKSREISFDKTKCIACEACVKACPYRAITIVF